MGHFTRNDYTQEGQRYCLHLFIAVIGYTYICMQNKLEGIKLEYVFFVFDQYFVKQYLLIVTV